MTTIFPPPVSIFEQVVPEPQLVRTSWPSTHCANCPPTQSIVPETQDPEEGTEDGVDGSVAADVWVVVLERLEII